MAGSPSELAAFMIRICGSFKKWCLSVLGMGLMTNPHDFSRCVWFPLDTCLGFEKPGIRLDANLGDKCLG